MDSSLIKLSVIIPIYNVERYLPQCFDSISPLTNHDDIQIILVNDGSTDNSSIIAQTFSIQHPNVQYYSKLNGGLSDARNYGTGFARGKYLFYLDSDDRIDSKKLLEAISYAEQNNFDWIQCGYGYDYENYILIHDDTINSCSLEKEEAMSELVKSHFVKDFAWGKIYKTEIIKDLKFPKGKYFEDSYWQYRVINNSDKLGLFPDIVTYYRCRPDSISGTFSIRNLDLIDGQRERLDFIIKNYSDIAPKAAAALWNEAKKGIKLSKQSKTEVKERFHIKYNEIKSTYSDLIKQGFREQPLLYRFLYYLEFNDSKVLSSVLGLFVRAINRMRNTRYKIMQRQN